MREIYSTRKTLKKAESLPGESGIAARGKYNIFCAVGSVCHVCMHTAWFQKNVLPTCSSRLEDHVFCLDADFSNFSNNETNMLLEVTHCGNVRRL